MMGGRQMGQFANLRNFAIPACAVALAGCASTSKPRPVELRTQTVAVEVRVACPDPVERERLRAGRPAPLASQAMPDSARERVAKTAAQLGRYEAPGAWADQVSAALDRCQQP